MSTVSIAGLDKARVLATLFNASHPQGMGFLNPASSMPLTASAAAEIIAEDRGHLYFDYLNGRVLKVDLTGDHIDARLYDRDNGDGALAAAIDQLRAGAAS